MTITNNPNIIQGAISLEIKSDHVFIRLIESAPFNIGKDKIYLGIPGNLVAFACRLSFQRSNEGYVSFIAKTNLIEHYETSIGAKHFSKQIMIIDNDEALKLTNKYFK